MKTVDISGMDKARAQFGYEWGCQIIMFRGLHWLRSRPTEKELPRITEFKNITGITKNENAAADAMEDFALNHPKLREFGATGAMVQFSLGHAMKRAELGDEAYFDFFRDCPDRIFEFDETEAFPERQKP